MASRSRRIFELAIKCNAEHEQVDSGNKPDIPSNLPNHITVEEIDNDLGTSNRRERRSSTSSTTSSSNSSSSSSTSFYEEDQRQQILQEYWSLGEIEKQWLFLANAIQLVVPLHRYVKVDSHGNFAPKRENNNAFYLTVSGVKIRVCKTFFKNTLAINNRPIETAIKKKNKNTNIATMKDERGCHGKHPRLDENITNGVKAFIRAIPKIESHYIRANSKRHYIDGSKTISDLHRDYVEKCKIENVPFASYVTFYRIFTQDFNISFFVPKKDLCDICEAFKNSTEEEKASEKNTYENHIKEKQLSRIEKEKDKNNKDIFVAVYDLQAVFQCPKGDISVFYYKSKLNVLNLTIYNIRTNEVESYVWDESNANRGVNEIGTCIFNYLNAISETAEDLDVVFYSDNCAGQQKNKFMISMYLYAVQNLPNLRSVTHKFLIKGHTQNEGDSAHSQIEREVKRQLRSGPMYTPDAFIGAIKAARKKSTPIHVNEMCYEDFIDWKNVCSQMNFALLKDEMGDNVKLTEIKVIRVQKDEPCAIWFKNSYAEEQLKKAVVVKKKRSNIVELKKAYIQKPGLAEKKKSDLMDLINKKMIPRYHRPFFEAL
ncbi:unnamed protein product [Euphydryas editha]|uniref:DUF7869 domain-containing protein n=1 Tax=Euphydryas editha TaxID=104508 RepID=A0AAU9TZP5_EUPED|nr:unnamed protein product [Euphydryas editha]